MPHAPQLSAWLNNASHPSSARPLQSWYAPVQTIPSHPVSPQVPVAFGNVPQFTPQSPQLLGSSKACSQPVARSPSQSLKFPMHSAISQTPVAQLGSALAPTTQRPGQEPQVVSVVRLVSQPLLGWPSQSPNIGSHSPIMHCPSKQRALAFRNVHSA